MKNTSKTGDIGELLAQKYLKSRGFQILDTKYLKKCGELDIVAKNNNIVHFVEIKTFTYDSKTNLEKSYHSGQWRPEELVDARKLGQIRKAAQMWQTENKWRGEVQVDVIGVRLVMVEKYSVVNYLPKVLAV